MPSRATYALITTALRSPSIVALSAADAYADAATFSPLTMLPLMPPYIPDIADCRGASDYALSSRRRQMRRHIFATRYDEFIYDADDIYFADTLPPLRLRQLTFSPQPLMMEFSLRFDYFRLFTSFHIAAAALYFFFRRLHVRFFTIFAIPSRRCLLMLPPEP